MRVLVFAVALLAPFAATAEDGRKGLVRDCIAGSSETYQMRTAREVSVKGGVTCPAGDIVGFPPRARTHNRTGEIRLSAGKGRVICPGTSPQIRNESSNNGSRGNVTFDATRGSVSVSISCRGASLGNGRRWYSAELVAQSCVAVTDDVRLDLTLDCAAKLN